MKLRLVEDWLDRLTKRVAAWLAYFSGVLTAAMVAMPQQWASIMEGAPWWAKLALIAVVVAAPASTQIVERAD